MRLLISHSSDCRSSVEAPASVAESIASISTMIVAKSALQPQQNFSVVPGRSYDASIRPQILHCEINSTPVPLGLHSLRLSSAQRVSSIGRKAESLQHNGSG